MIFICLLVLWDMCLLHVLLWCAVSILCLESKAVVICHCTIEILCWTDIGDIANVLSVHCEIQLTEGSMHACVIADSLTKWTVMVGQMSNLCRIQCTLPWMLNIYTANSLGFSRCRYYVRPTGEDRVTFCKAPRQCYPNMLLLNDCHYLGMNRNHTVVKHNWYSTLTQMFQSLTRKHSFVAASDARFEEPASVCTCESLLDSVLCTERCSVVLWCLIKCALLCCLPASPTDDSLTYFSIMQRMYVVGCSNSSHCLSQKPDKDSSQKPSSKLLQNVQQIMMKQVICY